MSWRSGDFIYQNQETAFCQEFVVLDMTWSALDLMTPGCDVQYISRH